MNEHWHLDKRVPIGLIAAILMQTIALGFWMGSLDSRISSIEGNRYTAAQGAVVDERISNNERNIERLETRTLRTLDEIKRTLVNIEVRLDEQDGE